MAAEEVGEAVHFCKDNRSPLKTNSPLVRSRSPIELDLDELDFDLREFRKSTRRKTLPTMPSLPPLPNAEVSPNLPKLQRHVKKLSIVQSTCSQPTNEENLYAIPPVLKRLRSNSTSSSTSTTPSPSVGRKCSPSVFITRTPTSLDPEGATFKRRNSNPTPSLPLQFNFSQDSAPTDHSFSNSSSSMITSTTSIALSPFSKSILESTSSPILGTSSSTFSLSSFSSYSMSSLNLLNMSDIQSFSNLSKFNHLLGRSLFEFIHDRLEKEEDALGGSRDELLSYLTVILRLHGNPADLFNSAFASELSHSTSLSTVMRNRSVSVRLFQTICTILDFQIDSTIQKLLKVFSSNSRLKLFTERASKKEANENQKKYAETSTAHNRSFSPVPHSVSAPFSFFSTSVSNLKRSFSKIVERLLNAQSYPPFLCYLCVQCTKRVEASELGRTESTKGVNLLQWTVASIVFLRFLVPTITHYASDESLSEFEKKAIVLLGRFLMKLSCRSTFHEYSSSSMVNVLLSETAPLLDKFCEDISSIGSQIHYSPALSGLEIPGANEVILVEFSDFLKSHCSSISKLCCELSISDAPSSSSSGHSGDIQSLCEDFFDALSSFVVTV